MSGVFFTPSSEHSSETGECGCILLEQPELIPEFEHGFADNTFLGVVLGLEAAQSHLCSLFVCVDNRDLSFTTWSCASTRSPSRGAPPISPCSISIELVLFFCAKFRLDSMADLRSLSWSLTVSRVVATPVESPN